MAMTTKDVERERDDRRGSGAGGARPMKVVLLAGGLGSRLREETTVRPKPLVEIGGYPMLWHIMNIYAAHGITDFIVCAGYKGYLLKEYFANLGLHDSDVTFDLGSGEVTYHNAAQLPWRVTVVDTGENTMTGGRVGRVREHLDGDEPFCLTYGDGVADVDIGALIAHHREHGRLATVTAVQPPGRFGSLEISGDRVDSFAEKPRGDGAWINGGFFVCEPGVGAAIAGDATKWEEQPLRDLAARGELTVFHHRGFWQAMDTLRERNELEALWDSGSAPWCSW
jgi:glucose-1-phosphate cytidylyltransferase